LLILRLAQTSFLVMIPDQGVQAIVASAIALAGACVLREAFPYR